MTNQTRYTTIVLALALGSSPAGAQSLPAGVGSGPGVGFELPRVGGSLQYAVSASELFSTGFYNSGNAATTNLSGDLAYTSHSQRDPFSAVYSGGVLIANSNQPTTVYQSLAFSQTIATRNWNFNISDSVSYLPQSPVSGLSGIPGVGDLGVDPIPVGPAGGIGILTTYGPRVSNTLSANASRILTARVSAQVGGYFGIQRFIGDNAYQGIDNTTEGASGGLTYRFDARNTLSGNYNYSNFTFSGEPYSFQTQGAIISYSRQWSRRLSTNFFIGPQIVTTSNPAAGATSTLIAGGANASYLARVLTYSLSYSRGVNNGSGVIPGSFSDNVVLSVHRQFGRAWNASGSLGYSRSTNIANLLVYGFDTQSVAASGQVTRALGRNFSAYGSYTLEDQSVSSNSTALNAFNGFYQVVGVGVTYSPRAISLGR